MTFDHAIHLVELLIAAGVLGYLKKITRLLSLFKDYPPHIHENGKVRYPPDFAPGKVQELL